MIAEVWFADQIRPVERQFGGEGPWVEAFYRRLSTSTLSGALDYAINVSGAPMRLYAQQPNSVAVRFEAHQAQT